MSKRMKRFSSTVFALVAFTSVISAQRSLTAKAGHVQPQPVTSVAESDRSRDGLVGPVRRVRTETAKLTTQDGKSVESKRVMLETASYDLKGNKTENQYFPIAGATLTGKEVYKYDDKGNISEMTLLNSDGSLLSREIYKYEYDFAGNWNRMITSVAVVESGRVQFETSEVTYRTIMYYLDENMLKTMQPNASPSPANTTKANTETKASPTVGQSPANNPPQNKKASSLPSSTLSADRLDSGAPFEVKTFVANSDSNAPLVALDSEPPSSVPNPILKPVSGGVLNGTALSLPAPAYPDNAKRMRAQGVVSVEVILDEGGKVISATATSGPTILRDTAVQAALKARFSPTKLSGQPVKVSGVINYKFTLSQ